MACPMVRRQETRPVNWHRQKLAVHETTNASVCVNGVALSSRLFESVRTPLERRMLAELAAVSQSKPWMARGRAGGRADERTGARAGGRADGRTDERTSGRADGRTDERADGRTGGRADARAGGRARGRAGRGSVPPWDP